MATQQARLWKTENAIWYLIGVLSFSWVFYPAISFLIERWETDPGASHGPLIPIISVFLIWSQREKLKKISIQTNQVLGVVIFMLGLLLFILSHWADVLFLQPISLLICIWSGVISIWGWELFKMILFPLSFLLFGIPWPDFLVEMVSFPLQLWTSTYSALFAGILGAPVIRDGVDLHIGDFALTVAAPCSGIRSLVALMAIAALFAYTLRAPLIRRIGIFLAGIPVALIANTVRVTSIILIAWKVSPKLAMSFFHEYSSPFLFMISCLFLMGLWKVLECPSSRKDDIF